ncbi:MAG: PAS domain S-box protein [Symploca sp. SIO2C1]|nr:PAS domain S-box protein [Symploca sp. SIO2C1]
MNTKSMTFRFPLALAEEVSSLAKAKGTDKTTVVVETLTKAFGLPFSTPAPVTTEALQQQLNNLENKIRNVSEQLAELRAQTHLDNNTLSIITALEQSIASFESLGAMTAQESMIAQETKEKPLSLDTEEGSVFSLEVDSQKLEDSFSEDQQANDQRQLIAQLIHHAGTLEQILSAAPDLIFVHDRLGRYTYINPAGARALGFERSYFIGKTFQELDFLPEITMSFAAQREAVFTTGRAVNDELSIPTVHGNRDYDYILSPIQGADGSIDSVVCAARDITERKQIETALRESEEKYRHLFEFANDSIFIIDASTYRFLNANWNAARRLGYTRQELLQLSVDEIGLLMNEECRHAIVQQLRTTGHITFECLYRCKDGIEIPVEISSRVIEYGNRLAFQSFVRDITERKQVEKVLHNSKK